MHRPQRLSAFMILVFLVLGCGKQPSPDTHPTPESNPTPGGPPPANPLPTGTPGIEGTYLIIEGEIWGQKMTAEEAAKDSELDRTVKISKDRIQLKLSKRETARYKLDPSKSPAEIDIFLEDSGKKATASYGIYKVEGNTLTIVMGPEEPQLRPREFKTLSPLKDGKLNKNADKQPHGLMMFTMKKVSDDTTFITEPPPKPKPPVVDVDGPVVAELKKKGFIAEKVEFGKFPGVNVTVPSKIPLDVIKELNGHPRIRSVTFEPTRFEDKFHPVTDDVIRALNKLDGLAFLEFQSCNKITAAAFQDLSRFPMLSTVTVANSPVDDTAVEEIAKLKTLEWVILRGTKIADKSLAALAKVRTLKKVWLSDAAVTASGIKLLNALPDLELLFLQGVPAADAALGELNMPKLKSLNFAGDSVTDEGLSKIPVLPALEDITLSGPKVTDAGLKHLQKQPSLSSVSLFDTKVTKAGVAELKKLKPKLSITPVD